MPPHMEAKMQAAPLPALRQELELLPAPHGPDGAPRWFLYDPVRHAFHSLGAGAVRLLSVWRAAPAQDILTRANTNSREIAATENDLKTLTEFLYAQKLTAAPPGEDTDSLAAQEHAKRQPLHEILVHKYLFFRIPLFNPQSFLKRNATLAAPFFHPVTWKIIALIGAVGLLFAARQWESFVRTFLHFFTLEGAVFYALTLVIIKSLHELGHAFAARHYGCRVPVIGLAFLVMFPILYTDTTDAWRLRDRKARLCIDGAGMAVELAVASLSIFLWSFLPDGPARSAAFFAATSSWVMSLFVNLNPFMRFDGYYLISDFFRIENLQKHGFAYGRWRLRERLFKLGRPAPLSLSPRAAAGYTLYAYCTWVYRFFLFIGIAILVHHIFPKAIGIVLFTIEILFFIAMPIWRELKVWGGQSMTLISNRRGQITLSLFALMLALFFIPWHSTARVPALLSPGQSSEIYPPAPAYLKTLHVKNGQRVERGQMLAELTAPHLTHERKQSLQRLALIDAQLSRMAASLEERRFGATLIEARAKEVAALKGIDALERELIIRAPYTGLITELEGRIHSGRYVKHSERLMRIIGTQVSALHLYPDEPLATRISAGAQVKFISDDPLLYKLRGTVSALAPTSAAEIEDRLLTSLGGGRIAVYEDAKGRLIPETQVVAVDAKLESGSPLIIGQHRGVAHIQVSPESPAASVWRSVMRVLIRETDF